MNSAACGTGGPADRRACGPGRRPLDHEQGAFDAADFRSAAASSFWHGYAAVPAAMVDADPRLGQPSGHGGFRPLDAEHAVFFDALAGGRTGPTPRRPAGADPRRGRTTRVQRYTPRAFAASPDPSAITASRASPASHAGSARRCALRSGAPRRPARRRRAARVVAAGRMVSCQASCSELGGAIIKGMVEKADRPFRRRRRGTDRQRQADGNTAASTAHTKRPPACTRSAGGRLCGRQTGLSIRLRAPPCERGLPATRFAVPPDDDGLRRGNSAMRQLAAVLLLSPLALSGFPATGETLTPASAFRAARTAAPAASAHGQLPPHLLRSDARRVPGRLIERRRLLVAEPALSADEPPSRDVHELGRRSGVCVLVEPTRRCLPPPEPDPIGTVAQFLATPSRVPARTCGPHRSPLKPER